MEKLFKLMVLISAIMTIILWLIPYFDYLYLKDDELDLLAYSGYNAQIPTSEVMYWSLLVAWLLVSAGLFFFVNIAKSIYTLLLLLSVVACLFWGFVVLSPIEYALFNILSLLDGAILAMLYLTPISTLFAPNKSLNLTGAKDAPPS